MTTHARWEFRLEIEGLGIEAVTHPDMEQTLSGGTSEGRIRVAGLKRDGLGFSEKVDMMRASTDGKGFTAKIVDRQRDSIWTSWFIKEPTAQTYLTSDASTTQNFLWVLDDSNISAGDVVHVGTEAMLVLHNTVSKKLSVSRAHWGSIAQYHYTQDGEKLAMPIVSVGRPLTLEGRRARLYRYRVGTDSLTGDGTQIYTGFISRDAKLSQNLCEWSISVDSPYVLLKQDLGGALEEEILPRGVYHPPHAPLKIRIWQWGTTYTYGAGADRSDVMDIEVSGFFATQEDFCIGVSDAIAAGTSDAGVGISSWDIDDIIVRSDGDGGWHFICVLGTNKYPVTFEMDNTIEGTFKSTTRSVDYPGNIYTTSGMSTGDSYVVYPDASSASYLDGAGSVPRGAFGGAGLPRDTLADGTYLYVGGTQVVDPTTHSVTIATGDDTEITMQVYSYSSSLRRIGIDPYDIPDELYYFTGASTLSVKLSRNYLGTSQRGNLADLRDALVTLGPSESNLGTVPFFTTSDIASWTDDVAIATRGLWYLEERIYEASGSVETKDLIENELRMINAFMAQDSTGKIGISHMAVPGPTDFSQVDLNESTIIISRSGFPQWERNAFGTLNTVTIKTGYRHEEEDYKGTTYTVRDVPAASARKALKLLEIKPLSRWGRNIGGRLAARVFGITHKFGYEDAVAIALPSLSIFGRPYSTITVDVSCGDGQDLLTTALLGEFVTITHPGLPNPSDGTRGISAQPAVIIGRDWDLGTGNGSLTLMTLRANRAGYTPSLWLSGTPTLVSGNTYDCTVSYSDPASVSLWNASDTGSNRIQVNDELVLIDFDSLNPSTQSGSVVQWNSATSVRVAFDASPSFSGEQYFKFANSDTAVSTQQLYAYWADADGTVTFSATVDASLYG